MKTTVDLIDMGDACFCQGDYYRALESYFPALKALEKEVGSDHPDVASVYYSIGTAYHQLHRISDALYYYNKALTIRDRVLGQNHPDTAVVYKDVAHIYSRSGYGYRYWRCDDDLSYVLSEMRWLFDFDDICVDNYKTAEDYYQKALAYYESSLPPDDASIREIREALKVMAAKKEEENNFALDNYYKVLEIRERLYGADSVRVAEILYCIGLVYSNMDDSVKAMANCQRSLELFRKVYGEEHYCVKVVRNQMDSVQQMSKKSHDIPSL